MKKIIPLFVVFSLLSCPVLSASRMSVRHSEEINKTLRFQDQKGPWELQLDNIHGSIEITGYKGKEVLLTAVKTIHARSEQRADKAKEEVVLDINQEDNLIDIYVDGPFRCQLHGRGGYSWRDPGYYVQYDFKIRVPFETSLYVKTVNKGDIRIENIKGDFGVRNVNGKIIMEEIDGSGTARTVNGRIKVSFSGNPELDCSFKTINGDLDLYFQNRLSADFRLKTFNGDAYTDFESEYIPVSESQERTRKGRYVFKSNRFFGVRIGNGGPEIRMETLNGDLLINKR
jgi:hypothetical protein